MPDSQAIGRLPPNVAGKVRGSVVAPSFASAIVEFVLNALDAASTKIHVQVDIENMQFQVKDNGTGMALDDFYSCGISGYTSKLQGDLAMGGGAATLPTYGFKGEAISSISHFASLEIVTMSRNDPSTAFSKVVSEGVSLSMARSTQRHEPGTTVTCTNLFHNRPVQRKALLLLPASSQSELSRIVQCLRSIDLINIGASITVQAAQTGAVLLSTARFPTVLHAFSSLLPARSASGLRTIDARGRSGGIRVSLILSSPFEPCRSRDLQLLFVNGRPCRQCLIHEHVEAAYTSIWSSRDGKERLGSWQLNEQDPSKRRRGSGGGRLVGYEPKRHPAFLIRISCPPGDCGFSSQEESNDVEFAAWDLVLAACDTALAEFLSGCGCVVRRSAKLLGERDGRMCAQALSAPEREKENAVPKTGFERREQQRVGEGTGLSLGLCASPGGNGGKGEQQKHVISTFGPGTGAEAKMIVLGSGSVSEAYSTGRGEEAAGYSTGSAVPLEVVGDDEWGLIEAAMQTALVASRAGCVAVVPPRALRTLPGGKAHNLMQIGSGRVSGAKRVKVSWGHDDAVRGRGQANSKKTRTVSKTTTTWAKPHDQVYFDEGSMMWREIADAGVQEHGKAGRKASGGGGGGGIELEGLAKRFAEWESPALGAATDHKIMSTSGWGKVSHDRSAAVTREMLSGARVVGQAFDKFVIADAGGCIICIDQHAADERVRYEAMKGLLLPTPGSGPRFGETPIKSATGVAGGDGKEHKRSGRHGVESWRIVRVGVKPPCPLRGLTSNEKELLKAHESALDHWGFKVTGLGGAMPRLVEVPSVLGQDLGSDELLEYLDDLGHAGGTRIPTPKGVGRVLASKACRGAVMFGDRLSSRQRRMVMVELGVCDKPFQCAHGRPTVVPLIKKLEDGEEERWGEGKLQAPRLGMLRSRLASTRASAINRR